MKAVITIGYNHFIVSPAVAVAFLSEAKQVNREYDGETGYTYSKLPQKECAEVDVKGIDESQIVPAKETSNAT